jgi:hypothetical protein
MSNRPTTDRRRATRALAVLTAIASTAVLVGVDSTEALNGKVSTDAPLGHVRSSMRQPAASAAAAGHITYR